MTTVDLPARQPASAAALWRAAVAAVRGQRDFDLVRWFAILSGVVILLLAALSGWFLGQFLVRATLERDAEVMTMFINSIVDVEDAHTYFATAGRDRGDGDMEEFFVHMGHMPGVLRANVYALDRRIVWSTEEGLVGRRFADNPELEEAFSGRVAIEAGTVGEDLKAEHRNLPGPGRFFVENYLPIWGTYGGVPKVVGVVEVYRVPKKLFATLEQGKRLIWIGAAAGALFLYLALFWIVRRAARIIREQQQALVRNETMAALGEMASVIAHGIRNPLAAIRSSAELALAGDAPPATREVMREIVEQADRVEGWVRQYLGYLRAGSGNEDRTRPAEAIRSVLAEFEPDFARRGVHLLHDVPETLPELPINPLLFAQVLTSLLANAREATPSGGTVQVRARVAGRRVDIEVADTGRGLDEEARAGAFEPFRTTKSTGLGLGLPLARQIVRRHGGELGLEPRAAGGAVATLVLPVADP